MSNHEARCAPRSRRSVSLLLAIGVLLASLGGALLPAPAGADDDGSPIGRLDVVRTVPGGSVEVVGWAIEPSGGWVEVHVYVDGVGTSVVANGFRQDLQAAFGDGWHGFNTVLPVGLGQHTVCAYGINAAGTSGENTTLGCWTINVTGTPFGGFDFITDDAGFAYHPSQRGSQFGAWAIDPDTSAPVALHVYVDGQFLQQDLADGDRNDVASLYPAYGPKHGNDWRTLVPNGTHQVCVYAINAPGTPGDNATLGCRTTTSELNNPWGNIDAVSLVDGGVRLDAWVIDKGNFGSLPTYTFHPETIDVVLDGTPVLRLEANKDRPDVVAFTNGMYRQTPLPRHGFSATIPVPEGNHQLCFFAIHRPVESGPTWAGDNVLLGCGDVTR